MRPTAVGRGEGERSANMQTESFKKPGMDNNRLQVSKMSRGAFTDRTVDGIRKASGKAVRKFV
jgi:hypothetical protein